MRRVSIAVLLAVVLAAGCTGFPAPFGSETRPVVELTPDSAVATPMQLNLGSAQPSPNPPSLAGSPPPKAAEVGAPTPGLAARPRQHITLSAPQDGAMLVNGTTVRGAVLTVPADKTLTYRVYDDHGRVVGRGPIGVSGDYGGSGTFEGMVNFAAAPNGGVGQLEVLDVSMTDGSVIDSAWINIGFGRRLAPFRGRTATISLAPRQPGSKFRAGDKLQGTTTVTPSENNLMYRVYDLNGNLVGAGPIKVTGEPGSPGSFAAPISFKVSTADIGRILVLDPSAADGRHLARAALNVTLAPADEGTRGAPPAPTSQPGPEAVPQAAGAGTGSEGTAPPRAEPEQPLSGLPMPPPPITSTLANRSFLPGIVIGNAAQGVVPQISQPPEGRVQAGLAEHAWYLKALAGQPLLPDSTITLQLGQDGRLGGFAGCNRYFSSYQLAGQTMRIDAPGEGRKVCPLPEGLMDQENEYLFALAAVERYRLEAGELQLFTDQDLPVLIFTVN